MGSIRPARSATQEASLSDYPISGSATTRTTSNPNGWHLDALGGNQFPAGAVVWVMCFQRSPVAQADAPITCPPSISGQTITKNVIANIDCTISNSTILGKVTVTTCTYIWTSEACVTFINDTINGNVTIQTGGSLDIEGGTLYGNISCQPGGEIFVSPTTTVHGNISGCSPLILV